MSNIQPSTNIYLCSGVNLDNDYKNTLYFASETAQANFFDSKVETTYSNNYYQRRTLGSIKIKANIQDIITYNYMFFNNTEHENKRYYCFINSMEYVNEVTTIIYYTIDVIQTYMFDMELLTSFVERCHSSTDTKGDNIVNENLELGELRTYGCQNISFSGLYFLILSTCKIVDNGAIVVADNITPTITNRNGIIDGLELTLVSPAVLTSSATSKSQFEDILKTYSDRIVNMWVYPNLMFTNITWDYGGAYSTHFDLTTDTQNVISQNTSFQGYTPKNQKLFTYPYSFLQINNNNGSSVDLKYEKFENSTKQLKVIGTTQGEAKVIIYPDEYNKDATTSSDINYGLMSAPFPSLSFTGDSYLIYLAQNKNTIVNNADIIRSNAELAQTNNAYNMEYGIVSSAVGAYVSAYDDTLGVRGASNTATGIGGQILQGFQNQANIAQSELNSISSLVCSLRDIESKPNSARGIQAQGITIQNNKNGFTQYCVGVDKQHAIMIDNFFTMYGYKQNKLMTPPIHNRTKYTYVKTVGCNLTGDIPNDDKNLISKIFDKGLTFWVNNSEVGDYSITNGVI